MATPMALSVENCGWANTASSPARGIRRVMARRTVVLHLVLQTGKREGQPVHLYTERILPAGLPAECVDGLPRRERQLQQPAGPVDELARRDIARPAELLGMDVPALRRDEQQLRRPAGQVPRQMRPVHQVHPACRPERRGHMPLLVRHRMKRHAERRRHGLRRALPREEAGHVGALHGPRARAGTDGRELHARIVHEQRLRQLRQALDMREQGIRLPQPELTGLNVQKA